MFSGACTLAPISTGLKGRWRLWTQSISWLCWPPGGRVPDPYVGRSDHLSPLADGGGLFFALLAADPDRVAENPVGLAQGAGPARGIMRPDLC